MRRRIARHSSRYAWITLPSSFLLALLLLVWTSWLRQQSRLDSFPVDEADEVSTGHDDDELDEEGVAKVKRSLVYHVKVPVDVDRVTAAPSTREELKLDNPEKYIFTEERAPPNPHLWMIKGLRKLKRECSSKSHKQLKGRTAWRYYQAHALSLSLVEAISGSQVDWYKLSSMSPRFCDVEFGCFSAQGEDGIILYILTLVGMANRKGVDIGAGVGYENNNINLAVNHDFELLLIDSSSEKEEIAKRVLRRIKSFRIPPLYLREFVKAETVYELIARKGFGEELDVLSIDIDGMDYWILKTLLSKGSNPRLIIVKIHVAWGPEVGLTRPYRADFTTQSQPEMGASITAYSLLLDSFGYRLVGCNMNGTSAFFLRNNVGQTHFPKSYEALHCFTHILPVHFPMLAEQLQAAKNVDWALVGTNKEGYVVETYLPAGSKVLLEQDTELMFRDLTMQADDQEYVDCPLQKY